MHCVLTGPATLAFEYSVQYTKFNDFNREFVAKVRTIIMDYFTCQPIKHFCSDATQATDCLAVYSNSNHQLLGTLAYTPIIQLNLFCIRLHPMIWLNLFQHFKNKLAIIANIRSIALIFHNVHIIHFLYPLAYKKFLITENR